VILSTLMGGITGSAIADASMQARILGKGMTDTGYARGFSAGVIGVSSLIVTMIPPSIGLILYGTIGEVSIGRLFAAGIVPGLLMALFMMVAIAVTGRRRGYQPERETASTLQEIGKTLVDCIWAFLFPVLLIVGLRFGFFTPSEAGAFAVAYAVVIGLLVYRELTWNRFLTSLKNTVLDIGMIMLIIAMSGIFSYGITWEQIPQKLAGWMLGITDSAWVLMLIVILFLLIAGMFIDSTVLILLLTSILLPVAKQVGFDPVHFGIIMVLTLTVGLLTPPVGVVMYSVCSILECSIGEFVKESLPLFAAVIIVILLVIFVPDLVLTIPRWIFGA
jgi:tripartite ATP-independent transporter DctM subunit